MSKTIAIIFGGRSVEHEISIRSAKNVSQQLDPSFEQVLIGISKSGNWYRCNEVGSNIENGIPLQLSLSTANPGFCSEDDELESIDVVFPILHGTDGEDGSIQGMFKTLNLPLVGSSVLGSAVCMDKILSKKILEHAGISIAPYLTYHKSDNIDFNTIVNKLGLPFMIKSGNLGSSVGISKVSEKEDFEGSLEDSLSYADEVLIESYIEGQEVECAVIGNKKIESTWPGEIVLDQSYDFYSYKAKYQDEKAIEMTIPARLPEEIQRKIRSLSEQAYIALKCNDYARVDLFVAESGKVFVNEINTIPGFTSASMFPVLWENMGVNYRDLLSKLIRLAIDRWNAESQLKRQYDDA